MKENSIEENIEILEKFKNNEMQRDKLERDGRCGGWKIGDIYKHLELDDAIDNILSDYKRVLKENKELEADNYELNNRINDLLENIPIQKVKDKIEELKQKEESDFRSYGFAVEAHLALQVLQELLESEELIERGEN